LFYVDLDKPWNYLYDTVMKRHAHALWRGMSCHVGVYWTDVYAYPWSKLF